ncbi:MAG: glutathione S-transferase [Pseudomonadota bacterium]
MTELPGLKLLVTCSTAPNPRRVSAFLAEKGVEVPRKEIDLATREHYSPEHLAKFGTHHLPGLELDDGTCLTETVAISRYVEALHPEPNLMGRDPLDAAIIEMWQRRAEFLVMLPVAAVFRHSHPSMATLEDQVQEWAESNRPRVMAGMELLDRRLRESPYIAGDRFTIADITAWISLDFMRVTKIRPPEDHEGLLRWQAELAERPSLARPKA